jgi:hypothetical protein
VLQLLLGLHANCDVGQHSENTRVRKKQCFICCRCFLGYNLIVMHLISWTVIARQPSSVVGHRYSVEPMVYCGMYDSYRILNPSPVSNRRILCNEGYVITIFEKGNKYMALYIIDECEA